MLQFAKVLKSNGTEGDVLIELSGIQAEEIELEEPVFIEFDGLPVPFFIESLTPRGVSRAIVHLTGISSLEDAAEVEGKGISAGWLEEEEDGESFDGWTVFDRGRRLGTVTGEEPIPGNPCLYVGTGQGEILIPLHEDFIEEADESARELRLRLPEGLY